MKKTWTICFLTIAVTLLGASAAGALEPTPRTGTGPFFPPDVSQPVDSDLTEVEGATGAPKGEVIEIIGTVTDTEGQPLAGAELVIWQTDIWGKYDHPREDRTTPEGEPLPLDPNFQYWGKAVSDAEGRYRFRTIVPGSYGRRHRHVHFRIAHPRARTLATELQFSDDPGGSSDPATGHLTSEGRSRLVVKLEQDAAGEVRVARFPIVLEML